MPIKNPKQFQKLQQENENLRNQLDLALSIQLQLDEARAEELNEVRGKCHRQVEEIARRNAALREDLDSVNNRGMRLDQTIAATVMGLRLERKELLLRAERIQMRLYALGEEVDE